MNDPHVKQLSITYWFVKWLVIIYMCGDFLLNLVKPIVFIKIVTDIDTNEVFTWAKSWLILSQEFTILLLTIQQTLILWFFYRLDQQQARRNRYQNRDSIHT